MPTFDSSSIQAAAIHHVGNKQTDEGFILSSTLLPLNEQMQELLAQYALTPFKGDEFYNLFHDDGPEHNELHACATRIFADHSCLLSESQTIARLLYDAGNHPAIKSGDLLVVLFHDCIVGDESLDAVGLFKSEGKVPFFEVQRSEEEWSSQLGDHSATASFRLQVNHGIDVNHLDKGAIIFNTEADAGFLVAIVDATNRARDAHYWTDVFLQARPRQDNYYHTHEVMKACKTYVTEQLTEELGLSRADQATLLNRSVQFFKQNESFDMNDFARDVIGNTIGEMTGEPVATADVVEDFSQYRRQYQAENDVQLPDSFEIDDSAVRRQARSFKSVIKLDKNFHIYIHGNRKLIEQGEDDRGKYYKMYYQEEQ